MNMKYGNRSQHLLVSVISLNIRLRVISFGAIQIQLNSLGNSLYILRMYTLAVLPLALFIINVIIYIYLLTSVAPGGGGYIYAQGKPVW